MRLFAYPEAPKDLFFLVYHTQEVEIKEEFDDIKRAQ